MTAEQQRIAIATAVGWTKEQYTHRAGCWISPDGKTGCRSTLALPDFLNDLNACAEFEKTLSRAECYAYQSHLIDIVREEKPTISECLDGKLWSERWTWHASAAQRCEAFLRTKDLWTDQ